MNVTFSAAVEAAIAELMIDRESVRAFIWDGVCRTRIRRNALVEAWAETYHANGYDDDGYALAALAAILAG